MPPRKRKAPGKGLKSRLIEFIFDSNVFPFVLTFATLGILFVLFRMKGVEVDYQISALNKDVEKVELENKELKAQRAKLLSVGKLEGMAKKYGFDRPKQSQIIIVP